MENKGSKSWFSLTDWIHDLDGLGGSAGLADTGLVLSPDPEDVLLVLHHVAQRGRVVAGSTDHGRLPLHGGPVAELNNVGSDLGTAVMLGGLPGDGDTDPIHPSNSDILRSAWNI